MNIFVLDKDPRIAAQMMCDKHVVKMILESAQMLCTAHRELQPEHDVPDVFYKSTHKNHPSSKWVRQGIWHYRWLYQHFCALCDEYTYRYGKKHLTDTKLRDLLFHPPRNIRHFAWFDPPPQCMPEEYQCDDTVEAYRNYYKKEKADFAKWTKRNEPEWWSE